MICLVKKVVFINPIKILVLFFSMTVQSIFLDELGLFRYCANVALKKAKGSQIKLFLYLYAIVAVLTVFTSNDIIILTFTPFICYFAKNARINPVPFLFAEFVAANTWSMTLIIGNPTNVYLGTSNGLGFLEYASVMLYPTILGGLTALALLFVVFRKSFKAPLNIVEDDFKIEEKGLLIIGVAHLSVCTILLVVSQYLNIEMWLITLCFALSLYIVSSIYILIKKKDFKILLTCIKRLPWTLVPFVLSMFLLVLGMEKLHVPEWIAKVLGEKHCVFTYGITSFLSANIINNIPMSVLFSSVTKNLSEANRLRGVYASIVGSNIGAFFTPLGALAGIMWKGILKKHDVEFKISTYIKYGALISIPTLLITLCGLEFISFNDSVNLQLHPMIPAVLFTIGLSVAGLKKLGVVDKYKETKARGERGLTLTEMFARSQTKFHALMIMYFLLIVVAVFVVMQVLPWQIMLALALILTLLSDIKTILKVNYPLLLGLWAILELLTAIIN